MGEATRDVGSCIVTRKENYAIVAFNRPDKLNAFDHKMFESMRDAFYEVADDKSIRAVVFTGTGDHFSAGGDVEEDINPLKSKSARDFKHYFEDLGELYMRLYNHQVPTIAAINGYALGAGMELALCCDIRIAANTAQMGEFFVKMGLVPEAGMCLLPKIVGMGMAKLLCYTGNLVSGEEACRIGLVEKVVALPELMPEAEKLAARLARGPYSISLMKRAINEFSQLSLEASMNTAIAYQFQASRTADHPEAVMSFIEKRKPNFKGE
ncbi:MAG: enoyl-CoA hydratase/isomerase family protein [Spirochaetes bacterium]|nr:MAG: enoyl-CoA hydratase/isomerase family protein [Spirochaetota bacterium]